MIDEDRKKKFLKALSALTERHKVGIAGCGCCGSPFLYDVNDGKTGGQYEYGF